MAITDYDERCNVDLPGFKIKCQSGLFCDKKAGYKCKKNELKLKKANFDDWISSLFKSRKWERNQNQVNNCRRPKYTTTIINFLDFLNSLNDTSAGKFKQHKKKNAELQRNKRSPFKIRINLGTYTTTAEPSTEEPSTATSSPASQNSSSPSNMQYIPPQGHTGGGSQQQDQAIYRKDMIAGGNGNRINRNLGATFIINNNYYMPTNEGGMDKVDSRPEKVRERAKQLTQGQGDKKPVMWS